MPPLDECHGILDDHMESGLRHFSGLTSHPIDVVALGHWGYYIGTRDEHPL